MMGRRRCRHEAQRRTSGRKTDEWAQVQYERESQIMRRIEGVLKRLAKLEARHQWASWPMAILFALAFVPLYLGLALFGLVERLVAGSKRPPPVDNAPGRNS
jgi:hypothetical protein